MARNNFKPTARPDAARALALCVLALLTASCRSKLDAHTKYTSKDPEPVVEQQPATDPVPETPETPMPVDVANGLRSSRAQFQTRNVMRLVFSGEALGLGKTVKLVNSTTGATLIAEQAIADAKGLALLSNDDILVTLYPMAAAVDDFAYGKNVLTLSVDGGTSAGAVATLSVELKDFDLVGPSAVGFTTPVSREGGLEGSFGFQSHVQASDGAALDTGAFSIMSH